MNITVKSRPAFIAAMEQFAPNHGTQAYRVESNGDVTVMVLDNCEHCNKECEGANSIIFTKPQPFIRDHLSWMLVAGKIKQTDVYDESGCTDDGDVVCPACHEKACKQAV